MSTCRAVASAKADSWLVQKQKRLPGFSKHGALNSTKLSASYNSGQINNRHDAELRCSVKGMKGRCKAIRVFLVGVLCGVIITAAVAFGLTIPANSDYWRMEIWKRGGGAWTFDKNGHISWAWTVEPIPDNPPKKRVIVPSSHLNVQSEKL